MNAEGWLEEVEPMRWEERPMPEAEFGALVHLREDLNELVWVDNIDLHFDKFVGYSEVWFADEALKKREKANKLAQEEEW